MPNVCIHKLSFFFSSLKFFYILFIIILWHWEYIMTFTKVLIIYHTWSFSFIPLSPFLEQFQQVLFFHFHTWIHNISTIFTFLLPFPRSSSLPLVQTLDRTCFTSCSVFLKRHFCLREFHCDISMYLCIIHPLYFSPIYLRFPSYGEFNRCTNSIFIFV
jgi:hypothetical protein